MVKTKVKKHTRRKILMGRTLENYVINEVENNYLSFQNFRAEEGKDEDIYNDFNDELLDEMEQEGCTRKEINEANRYIQSNRFWKRLYQRGVVKKGLIMW